MTANGQPTEPDPKQIQEVKAKAETGGAKAQYDLGLCYARGEGVAKDELEAVKWFRKAAEQNYPAAQVDLGICYAKGKGVPKDEVEAVRWFRKAAEQNLAKAQGLLGVCYADGTGVTKNDVEAVRWFRKAAEQNYAEAQAMLAAHYDKGTGISKDQVEAVKWSRKAAEQNVAMAQAALGFYYATGQGVAKHYVEAYKWLLLAAGQGDVNAKNNMSKLKNLMTPEQVAEGQRLARDFKPTSISAEPPAAPDSHTGTQDDPVPIHAISTWSARPHIDAELDRRFGAGRWTDSGTAFYDRHISQVFVALPGGERVSVWFDLSPAYEMEQRRDRGEVETTFDKFMKTKEGQKAAADLRKALMADPKARAQLEAARQLRQFVTGRHPAQQRSGCFAIILAAALFTGFIARLIIR